MTKDYATLAARMREKPTFASAEEVIKKDYPLKLPSRTFIHLWNTPEISQFRGYQEDLDKDEENKEKHEKEKIEINHAAREAGTPTVDMSIVHDLVAHQRQSSDALRQHMEGLSEINRQHLEGMRAEQRAELERLANEQNTAANRAAMAEQALVGLRDVALEHRDLIGQLAQQQGVRTQNIDNSHTSTEIHHHHHDNENLHNQAMDLMRTHAGQFGQYMQQQNLNAEQMQRLLHMHLAAQQQPGPQIFNFHQQPQAEAVVQYTGGGGGWPPGAPPGAGAIKIIKKGPGAKAKKEPRPINITYGQGPPPPQPPGDGAAAAAAALAPEPIPVPTIQSAVPHFNMATPRRSRSTTPRRARSSAVVPWKGGEVDPPAMPAATGEPRKRASEEESTAAPVAVRAKAKARARSSSATTIAYPKSMARSSRSRSSSSIAGTVAETVAYPDNNAPIRPASRSRSRSRGGGLVVLPTEEDAEEHAAQEVAEVRRRGKSMALQTRALVNASKFTRSKAKPKSSFTRTPRMAPIPEAAVPDKKPRVRKVAIVDHKGGAGEGIVKRGRGRPKGALGKKKREAAWLEAESRKIDAVRL